MNINSFEIEVLNGGQSFFKSGPRTISQAIEIHNKCLRKYFSDFETNKVTLKGNYMLNIYSDAYIEKLKILFPESQESVFEVAKTIYQIYTKGHMSIILKHSSSDLVELRAKQLQYDA